ncbi:zeta toxin family protein [Akkermansia muciniphila]|uniref:zeta toxin family protein n=1 Tax=Akkermansia muciniphila TaxID=239935 RepID=UPI001BFFCFB1|nr:hypothetical protein [Akkermansia muciniphila]
MKKTPQCHIVAGPNGAGKTTFALDYLMHETNCRAFINADMIAQGLSPLAPQSVQVKAGKLFLEELKRHLKQKESFCFETTLSGSSYLQKINQWRKDGWHVILHYLWIPNAQFSALRVQERVAQGGHDIPHKAILRRYDKSLRNLFNYLPICNEVMCYDNSDVNHPLIFTMARGKIEVINAPLYKSIQQKTCP